MSDVERELKFADVEHEAIRERLLDFEAERLTPPSLEDNWIFDREGDLGSEGRVLRLRVDGYGALLTLKGLATYEGGLKIRSETQTRVDDGPRMRSILEGLGYEVVKRYQKMREEWSLGSVTIALDHTPIGDFAEFEGDGAVRVAKRCGLEADKAEKRSYLRLYEDWRTTHQDAPFDMVFEEGTSSR